MPGGFGVSIHLCDLIRKWTNLVIGVVGSTPPVAHGGDVAVAVAAEDVVGPGETITLCRVTGVPVVVQVVEGGPNKYVSHGTSVGIDVNEPFGLPNALGGVEGGAWRAGVAVGGDDSEVLLSTGGLDTWQKRALSFPA